ncbi:helix-turn-helix domain-containing protein [Nonomuraea sp. NPDC050478]|uniref:helix-turn-helix domain-containing protein n=1 Tax=Nonomuraea sp. NPDC050478 TaxID=3364365 RepID=UPI0037B162AC
MSVLRSLRLEALLDGAIPTSGALEYRHLQLLVAGQVGEAEDLDYKRALYGNSDKDRRSLCTDVAALASTRGGLLILGIDEDAQGRAIVMTDVTLSDAEATRMHQVIASGVHPLPTFEIIPVENPARTGTGCYAIAVAAGPRRPYAVAVNDGYRYPHRIGTTIGYLTEPEIETAYRRRDAVRRDQSARAQEIEEATTRRIPAGSPWVMVSLVPEQPGQVRVDAASFAQVRQSYEGTSPMIVDRPTGGSALDYPWRRVTLGQRRFIVDDQPGRIADPLSMAAELYDDGSGTFAHRPMHSVEDEITAWPFIDELVIVVIISGLRFLTDHALNRAQAAGAATVCVTMTPSIEPLDWQLIHFGGYGQIDLGSPARYESFRPAEAASPLDVLATGPGSVSTAALLANEIFQGFGQPENLQISQQGEIRPRRWSKDWRMLITDWADDHDVGLQRDAVATH